MAAAVSQLCVRQGSTLLDVSSSTKAVMLNRFHLFFTYISTSFQVQNSIRSVPCQVMYRYIYTGYGSRLTCMAEEEKSTFQISSLLLSSFISNIYTPEKGYYWQNQPNSLKIKGYQEVNSNVKQLLH